MTLLPKLLLCFALLQFGTQAPSQEPSQTIPQQQQAAAEPASVTFLFDWNVGQPWRGYSMKVDSSGQAHFVGQPNPAEGGDGDEFEQDFLMSTANRQKIFELAQKAHYFQGDFDFRKKIAQTGKKTLEYQSPKIHGTTSYNWSENPDIQQLTHVFQATALTLDYGRKLAFQYRFDKLGMDQRLRELQDLQAHGEVEELSAIQPVLRKIAEDPNMMHISRQSAKQLLRAIQNSGSTVDSSAPASSVAAPQR